MDLVLSMLEVRFSDDIHIVTRTQYIGVNDTTKKKARNFQLGQLLNKLLAKLQRVVATLQVEKKANNIHSCADDREVSRESLASHM